MFFERKAYIEFLDNSKIRITTPFRQKDFDLQTFKDGEAIDLIQLTKKENSENIKFLAEVSTSFTAGKSNKDFVYILEVFANNYTHIGDFTFDERNKLFKCKIFEEE